MIWWIPLAIAAVQAQQKAQATAAQNKANQLKSQELAQGGDWQQQMAELLAKKKEDEWVGGQQQNPPSPGGFYG